MAQSAREFFARQQVEDPTLLLRRYGYEVRRLNAPGQPDLLYGVKLFTQDQSLIITIRRGSKVSFLDFKVGYARKENSLELSTQLLSKALKFLVGTVAPAVEHHTWKQANWQMGHMMRKWLARQASVMEGKARDFFARLAPETPRIVRGKGNTEYWKLGGAVLRVWGSYIALLKMDEKNYLNYESVYRLVRAYVNRQRRAGIRSFAQIDDWNRRGLTHSIHSAIARLIEQGYVDQGDSVGDVNNYTILDVAPVAEAQDYLPGMDDTHSYRPGFVRDWVKHSVAQGYRSGEPISSGRSLRRLVSGCRIKAVYIWPKDRSRPHFDAKLVIVILLSQGYGNPDREWVIEQDWASGLVLAGSLHRWRNLQGVPVFVNGVPAGKISRTNPPERVFMP